MKRVYFFLTGILLIYNLSFAQDRDIVRGATPGELYLTGMWYGIYYGGPPVYSTLRTAVYHLTENGKKLTKQYDANYFANPEMEMQPSVILADATFGVVYNKSTYFKNSYSHTSLWVSFDYGENWIFREENMERNGYYAANVEGLIYKAYYLPFYVSFDYGYSFSEIDYSPGGSEPGLQNGEGYSVWFTSKRLLRYSNDFGKSFLEFPIDEQFVFGQIWGIFPDVYRGGLPGEVYISSMFPGTQNDPFVRYKVSFSADTGHTFRHVYVSEPIEAGEDPVPVFMSDREPGVFYIVKSYQIEDKNPWGWHTQICVEYYRDYGETLEAFFCHDITKNYEYEEIICENTTHLEANVINNSIQLQWATSIDSKFIRGYHVFRNHTRITTQLLTESAYLDENLPIGNYEYYVRPYYKEGCVSDSSNHVIESVEVGVKGVKELEGVRVYPNPTTGELRVMSYELQVTGVEIFDIYGRKLFEQKTNHPVLPSYALTVFPAGVYFVKITTEQGIVMRKVVKM
jgi:hypothetical protein